LAAADPQEGAEEQALEAAQDAVVERQEQEPERESRGLDGADRRRLAAVPARAVTAPAAHQHGGGSARHVVAERARKAGQGGARPARKGHQRKRVSGEGLAAQDHVPPDHGGEHGHDGAGLERVDHEREGQQLVHVVDRIPGQRRGAHSWRPPWWWGASGWPTTTRRPSVVRSTSIGAPNSAVSVGRVMTSSTDPSTARPAARYTTRSR